MPPQFCALKVKGQRAYELARDGSAVELRTRLVKIHAVDLLRYEWPLLNLRVDCGRGTYIRAIARDVGQALGIGGYLTALRRTRIGPFTALESVNLESITPDNIESLLRVFPPLQDSK